MEKILILGASGQLGSEFKYLLDKHLNYSFIFASRDDVDISNFSQIREFIDFNNITVIINCAAYTNVDKAENERNLTDLINYKAVENLGNIAKNCNIKLIHISTDYVFDGKKCLPYCEFDQTFPLNHYGLSKLMGEQSLINLQVKNCVIIRTSWLYGDSGRNFVFTMLNAGMNKDSLSVVFDQIGTPTSAKDLASTILQIIPQIHTTKPEVYHYSNEGVASWYDFARAIMDIAKINCQILPITSKNYPTIAMRPSYSVLDKSKIKQDFGIAIPYWRDSLAEIIENIKEL